MNSPDSEGESPMPVTGLMVTEMEATLVASGGIAGAKEAVRLMVGGTERQIRETVKLIQTIKGGRL